MECVLILNHRVAATSLMGWHFRFYFGKSTFSESNKKVETLLCDGGRQGPPTKQYARNKQSRILDTRRGRNVCKYVLPYALEMK